MLAKGRVVWSFAMVAWIAAIVGHWIFGDTTHLFFLAIGLMMIGNRMIDDAHQEKIAKG